MDNTPPPLHEFGEQKLPDRLKGKFCPYPPPIPIQNPLDPKQITFQRVPCAGELCATWDTCQGADSPRAIRAEIKEEISLLRDLIKPLLKKVAKNPLLSRLFGG